MRRAVVAKVQRRPLVLLHVITLWGQPTTGLRLGSGAMTWTLQPQHCQHNPAIAIHKPLGPGLMAVV